jgi:hypothetical protein
MPYVTDVTNVTDVTDVTVVTDVTNRQRLAAEKAGSA